MCHSFGAAWAANMFADYMKGQYGKGITDTWGCRESGVIGTSAKDGTHVGPFADQCESVGDAGRTSPDGSIGGETGAPVGLTGNEAS